MGAEAVVGIDGIACGKGELLLRRGARGYGRPVGADVHCVPGWKLWRGIDEAGGEVGSGCWYLREV